MSYRNLEVWQLARRLTSEIHLMTIKSLPKFEMYEVGSQIRRSIKSVRSNIVEGYGRRRYKNDFIRFLTFALSSCDETRDHLDVLHETRSLDDDRIYENLVEGLEELGKKLNNLVTSVDRNHRAVRECSLAYAVNDYDNAERSDDDSASSIQHPGSFQENPDS
jgi:four helix bundle protein